MIGLFYCLNLYLGKQCKIILLVQLPRLGKVSTKSNKNLAFHFWPYSWCRTTCFMCMLFGHCEVCYGLERGKKSNLKWIKELNIRPETINLLKKTGKEVLNNSLGKDCLDMTPKVKTARKSKNMIKLEYFCTTK